MEQFYIEDKFSLKVIFYQLFFFSFFSRISRCVSSIVLRSRFNEAETRPKLFCGASIFSAFVSPTMCLYFSWYEDFVAKETCECWNQNGATFILKTHFYYMLVLSRSQFYFRSVQWVLLVFRQV